jgi:GNAT superfamily N-acetyltransferase
MLDAGWLCSSRLLSSPASLVRSRTTFFTQRIGEAHRPILGEPGAERLVRESRAHAALVFDGDVAVAWCQFGSPQELPNIKHRKEYEAGLDSLPDYRLTCFFVDKRYRRRGVSALALQGALDLIAAAGGGVVEAYPQDTGGKKITASFLYSVTRSLFEQAGFGYVRPKGKNHTVMRTTVKAAR